MPELPEVETIARRLRDGNANSPALPGRMISSAVLAWPRTLATPSEGELLVRLPGQTLETVSRRGKFLLFQFEHEWLLAHLRMSGDMRVEPAGLPSQPHDRFWLEFFPLPGEPEPLRLAFNDARKFGRVWLVRDPSEVLAGLGPEPFDLDFTPERFYHRLHARRRLLKPLLLDQSFVAGLGNIYTDEALHMARLHPNRLSHTLSAEEAGALWEAIRAVLAEGIRRNGASFDWVYRGGDFQNYFRAYQRTGEPCPVCGTPIQRLVVGQRGTHICPVCQSDITI